MPRARGTYARHPGEQMPCDRTGNPARPAESAGRTQVFTSGGNRYDPLNTDLP